MCCPDICGPCVHFSPNEKEQRVDPKKGDLLSDPWGDKTPQHPPTHTLAFPPSSLCPCPVCT